MGYIGATPSNAFINNDVQRVTNSTNNYVDLDHNISSLNSVIVFVNNVRQESTNLTFTSASRITLGDTLTTSDVVEIVFIGKAVATQSAAANSITNSMLAGSIANDKLAGSIANSKLANSSVSINGSSVSLGGSLTGIGEDNTPYFLTNGTGTQSLTEDVNTTLQFNALRDSLDSASGFNTSTYTYTVQSGGAGFWYLAASSYVQSISQDKQVDIAIYINGAEWFVGRYRPGATLHQFVQVHAIHKLTVGNAILVKIFHNDNGARNAVLNSNSSFFGGYRIKTL